ncbi:MAG: DUF488 family protein [Enhygromyxa sp.]
MLALAHHLEAAITASECSDRADVAPPTRLYARADHPTSNVPCGPHCENASELATTQRCGVQQDRHEAVLSVLEQRGDVMIERQRILLSLVDRAGGESPRTHLMKWLFLLREEQPDSLGPSSFYEFIPYKSGPFSFQAYRDLSTLEDSGFLQQGEASVSIPASAKRNVRDEVAKLPRRATRGVDEVLEDYGRVSRRKLLDDVYDRYPWYASRSELRPRKQAKAAAPAVYTVGYEGRTIDGLLDHSLRAGMRRLIDVRKNAMSRKYGFGGRTIARLCADVDIEYVHVPAVGIPSSMRTDLSTQATYDRLFDLYEKKILPGATEAIEAVAVLCAEKASALMCFEASSCQCHRGRLASWVADKAGLGIKHL